MQPLRNSRKTARIPVGGNLKSHVEKKFIFTVYYGSLFMARANDA
jgi:hypothetical protein